ncbi:M50 family metallopeptidase [Symbioplanes lichenis]|uniref:M50 family metallopeptidase n=1 Tax=Symbioplanes lichenis TaxID=1629072 RepID=UPI0027398F40|nr:M50 family metallopeptidase [Actinoplanes lichenis]
MAYVIGVVIFALALSLSVALHEAGHLFTARAFGMRVRRFFVGRGPTLFSVRRGGIEYGVKALPLGGFCDIAGLTALDELTPAEEPRAMWRHATWKRIVVLASGSVTHVLLALTIVYAAAVSTGLPNPSPTVPPVVASSAAPALLPGDRILAVRGQPTPEWDDVVARVRASSGPTPIIVSRTGETLRLTVDVPATRRIGVTAQLPPAFVTYGPGAAVGATLAYTGDLTTGSLQQLARFPERVPAVVSAIGGGERDPDTPVSMVGASRLGGEAADRGLWPVFLLLLASFNLFMALFNLLPLLPLDGGHIMIAWYEKLRGRGPVDYTRLLPLTVALMIAGGAIMLLTVAADVVNPIRLS